MSFTRINPGGWALGAPLTHTQLNALDSDHANALDKTVAGDTLSGAVTMAGTASILVANAGAAIKSQVSSGIQSSATSGIVSTALGGIQSQIYAGFQTTVAGGFMLSGGGSDEVQYGTTRTKTVGWGLFPAWGLATGWSQGAAGGLGPQLKGPGGSAAGSTQPLNFQPFHQGAQLTNIRVFIKVAGAPHSGVPTFLPFFEFLQWAPTTATLTRPASGSASPGSASAWDATMFWDIPVSPALTIDRTQFVYYARLTDEWGNNANTGGNAFTAVELTFANIGSMAFE